MSIYMVYNYNIDILALTNSYSYYSAATDLSGRYGHYFLRNSAELIRIFGYGKRRDTSRADIVFRHAF